MRRVLLVTGGSRGIGRATALLAATRGFDVAVHYRERRAEAEEVVQAVKAAGGQSAALQADLSHPEQIERLYREVDEHFGRLDAVVNSAGISQARKPVAEMVAPALTQLFSINVIGLIVSCREATLRLSRAHGGRGGVIVNVSSMAATIGGRPGSADYAASKAAVDAFSVGFAKEVASDGIRVVSLRPGMVATDMTRDALANPAFLSTVTASIPLGRAAEADEVAQPIVFLLSDAASFITGTCVDVSGGGFHIARGTL